MLLGQHSVCLCSNKNSSSSQRITQCISRKISSVWPREKFRLSVRPDYSAFVHKLTLIPPFLSEILLIITTIKGKPGARKHLAERDMDVKGRASAAFHWPGMCVKNS